MRRWCSAKVVEFSRKHGSHFRVITGDWRVDCLVLIRHGAHGLFPAPNFVPEQSDLHRAAAGGDWHEAGRIHGSILPLMQPIRKKPGIDAHVFLGTQTCFWRTRYDPGAKRVPDPQSLPRPGMESTRILAERLGGTE